MTSSFSALDPMKHFIAVAVLLCFSTMAFAEDVRDLRW